jgi:hypothetical protein
MDNNIQFDGTIRGALTTLLLWIFASVTLSQAALFMTILSAAVTIAYTIYKWRKGK